MSNPPNPIINASCEAVAESRTWSILSSETLCETPHLTVVREVAASPLVPSGRPWLVVRRKSAVVIVPQLPDGTFVLVRQERVPARRLLLEFPAGQIESAVTPSEIETTARKELLEETGYHTTRPVVILGSFFSSPGFTNERQTIVLAMVDQPHAGSMPIAQPEGTEAIAGVALLSMEGLRTAIATGEICDANTLAAFAFLQTLTERTEKLRTHPSINPESSPIRHDITFDTRR